MGSLTTTVRMTMIYMLSICVLGPLTGAAHADGTSCMISPRDGSFPPHVREALGEMHAYQPEKPAGWVERTRRIDAHRRLVRDGLLRETGVPEDARAITGEFWVPVLPAAFANSGALPFTASQMQLQLFTTAPGTMRDYFDEISYGFLDVLGNVSLWQTVSGNDSDYEGGNNGFGEQIVGYLEGAFAANDAELDFGLFDNDGPDGVPNSGDDDGVVDVAVVMHSELGGECGGAMNRNIWSHQFYYSAYTGGGWVTNDGRWDGGFITIDRYIVVPGMSCTGGPIEIGILCHELGHSLGIKDLYDTNATLAGDSEGLGDWALMAGGNWNTPMSPAHMSAFSKHRLGWLNVLNLQSGEDQLCIPPVETNNVAVRLWQYGAVTPEYFLVENRQRLGYDANLNGEGLVIYHVDEDRYDAQASSNAVNADERFKGVDLECADATSADNDQMDADDLDAETNTGDATDVFCAESVQNAFSPFTIPDTNSNSGVVTGVAITNIESCDPSDDYVCAEFSVGVATPVDVCMNDCAGDDCNEIATCDEWWGSPDIWVDNDGDGDDDIPSWGVENRLYTRVNNTGPEPAALTLGVVYLGWSAMGIVWPDDATHTVGYTGFPIIGPGESETDWTTFQYPGLIDQNGHYCIGVVLQQDQDPALSSATHLSNNIAQINHQVLVDRGLGGEPARGGVNCGSVLFETWVRLYDGANPEQNSIECEVRVGTHPDYDDVVLPPGWSFQIDPQMGPFLVSPVESDSVLVTIWSASATSGEMAHLPLTLWNRDTNEVMGGLVIDALADCAWPQGLDDVSAAWIPPYGDAPDGPNVLVEWTPATLDILDGEENILHYEIYRAGPNGLFSLRDVVAMDADPERPRFQWTDHVPASNCPGASWQYKVKAYDLAGNGEGSNTFVLECDVPPVDVETPLAPETPRLLAIEPNPLEQSTEFVFSLAQPGGTSIDIYNARGQLVRRLLDEWRGAATHRVHWDGRGGNGERVPSGVYFARVSLPGGMVDTRKLTVMW